MRSRLDIDFEYEKIQRKMSDVRIFPFLFEITPTFTVLSSLWIITRHFSIQPLYLVLIYATCFTLCMLYRKRMFVNFCYMFIKFHEEEWEKSRKVSNVNKSTGLFDE